MRRHPKRLSPRNEVCIQFGRANHGNALDGKPKRGPKNKKKRWPLLNYTIDKGVGVVFHES